jgi:hypothetical protein
VSQKGWTEAAMVAKSQRQLQDKMAIIKASMTGCRGRRGGTEGLARSFEGGVEPEATTGQDGQHQGKYDWLEAAEVAHKGWPEAAMVA